MKVGDLVARAYTWNAFVPGIIVDEKCEMIELEDDGGSYEAVNFFIAWSDGTMSIEQLEELLYLEECQ